MAIQKIEFEDKVSTITSPLPAINRIRDVDVNEIKDVVNNNADELETAQENISNLETSTDFSGSVTFSETDPANYIFRKCGKVVCISYRGAAKTHATDSAVFTIPSDYRPPNNVYAPFTKGGTAYGVLEIAAATGVARVVFVSSTSSTDRLVVNISYIMSN